MTKSERPFQAICFDCDSTLSRIEGIDELASRAGVLNEIAPLTRAAMDGGIALDEIYGKRLHLVAPHTETIAWLGQRYIDEMVSGAKETVQILHGLKKSVHIVSGGIRQAILPLAKVLNIPDSNVHAVNIAFKCDGSYENFDTASPLITPSGKSRIVGDILAAHGSTAMIGDGLTDLAAGDAGAYVIGFGGVERRDIVVEGADDFIGASELTAILEVLLLAGERATIGL